MSATIVRAKRQTTLPEVVCHAAGIRIRDQVEWRFEDGEIRGRKLIPIRKKARVVRPVRFNDLLIMPQNLEIDLDRLDDDLRQEREEAPLKMRVGQNKSLEFTVVRPAA